jgi:hypothetical protein
MRMVRVEVEVRPVGSSADISFALRNLVGGATVLFPTGEWGAVNGPTCSPLCDVSRDSSYVLRISRDPLSDNPSVSDTNSPIAEHGGRFSAVKLAED